MEMPPLPAPTLPAQAEAFLRSWLTDPTTRQTAKEQMLQLVNIDTTPKPSPQACARAEKEVFDIIERFLTTHAPSVVSSRAPIRPDIADHPDFTLPYYTGQTTGPRNDIVRQTYRERGNLLARWPNPDLPVLALNAHIDTVAPHVGGRVEGDQVHGRGSVDDKGACVVMMLTAWLLETLAERFGIRPACELLLEFVIDEETGGNGSLSVALDKTHASADAIVVLECTQLRFHPANRGAVWYSARLDATDTPAHAPADRDHLLEAMAFAVGSLSRCGDGIKSESNHPLFPHRPVQTCHGILGTHGQHPSRVNDYVPLLLRGTGGLGDEIRLLVDEALVEYCARYGDKTRPGAADATLKAHTAWTSLTPESARLEVFGLTGHMGSVDRLDGAITKAAAIVRKLVTARRERGPAWAGLTVTLQNRGPVRTLTLEGGQGFLPTHELDEVCRRIRAAVEKGVRLYTASQGLPEGTIACQTTFDKLRNAAFARPADGPAMRAMLEAGRQTGIYADQPIRGWGASCDARIFAREFPNAEIVTFGPGHLSQAHANDEHVNVNELLLAAMALARAALAFGAHR